MPRQRRHSPPPLPSFITDRLPPEYLAPVQSEYSVRKDFQDKKRAERRRKRKKMMGRWQEELQAVYNSWKKEMAKAELAIPPVLLTDVTVREVVKGRPVGKPKLSHLVAFTGALSGETGKMLAQCYDRYMSMKSDRTEIETFRKLIEDGHSTFSAFTNTGNIRDLLPGEGIRGSNDISYDDGVSVRDSVVTAFLESFKDTGHTIVTIECASEATV